MKLKPFLLIYFTLIITLVIINACTLNKRIYRPGYNIEWIGSHKTPVKRELANNSHIKTPATEITNPLKGTVTASAENSITPLKTQTFLLFQKQHTRTVTNNLDGCDTIIFKNGLKIKAKILEIGSNEIKYKMCDNQDGPLFIKNTNDIARINHANGSVTELAGSSSNTNSNTGTGGQPITKTTSSGTSGKSQILALVLCGFLGFLGIHRFYLGYIGLGVLMLLTGGCCGILWIVDFVRLLTGDLKPTDGDFSEKL